MNHSHKASTSLPPLLAARHSSELMKLNQLPAGWKPSTRLTVKEWVNEYVIGKLLIWKSILRVLASQGKGHGERNQYLPSAYCVRRQEQLYSFIFSEMYYINSHSLPLSPRLSQHGLKKGGETFYHGIRRAFEELASCFFCFHDSCLLVGGLLSSVAQPFPNGTRVIL